MAYNSSYGDVKQSIEQPPLPPSNHHAHSLKRLTIDAASSTALPASPKSASPARTLAQRATSSSSPNGKASPRSPLRRSPSSMSLDTRSSTPSLHRKASMNSLHGVGGPAPSRSPSRASPSRASPSRASPSRRSSSASFLNASTMVGKSPLSGLEDMVETPRHTAESIASNHFKVELDMHDKEENFGGAGLADSIVILHEACYGHRYSRPRTTRAELSTIVERPERINASILGISVAYVRLGERYAEGQHYLHPDKDPSAIPTTPFRIRKTSKRLALTSQAVTNVHGMKWMEELKIMCENAESKLATNGKELTRPDMGRGSQEADPFHEGDLYLCEESLNAMEGALGAVCDGVDAVFQGSGNGKGPHRTFVAIRPPGHHCSANYPSGFCWLNNVHVGISHAALTHGLTHAAIIDFDLHHGDGSQTIAYEQNARAIKAAKNSLPWKKTSIGYFSLHDINSYPCERGDEEKVKNASLCIENAHGQSIWNVHFQPWKSEAEFWELYESRYSIILEKTRGYLRAQTERLRLAVNGPKPKGAIFISAGFDASEWEGSGMQRHKVNVPTEFYARLTRDIVKLAAEEGSGVDGRIISVLEGGYSNRALCTGVLSHISGLVGGDPIAIKKEFEHNGLGYEMGQKISTFNGVESSDTIVPTGAQSYDPSWWSLPRLEQLDATVIGLPVPEPKKPRDGIAPTYSSPTTSFIAKVTSPEARRRVSNMSAKANGSPRAVARPPSPPPPEVDWTVAAHELSKLLIPTVTRQTESYTFEELAAEATRIKKDRQSVLPASIPAPEAQDPIAPRMALRTRKPAKPLVDSADEDEVKKPAPKANRRKTVAGPAALATENAPSRSTTPRPEPGYTQATKQSSRRLSIASTISDAPSERTNGHVREPSIGSTVFPIRSSTSASMRPDSSMSSRGHSIPPMPLAVKKSRAPAQPRVPAQPKSDPSKTSRIRRKSPLTGTAEPTQNPEPISRNVSVVIPSIEQNQTTDVDSLTAGMGNVSLKNNAMSNPQPAKTKIKFKTPLQREQERVAAQVAGSTTNTTSKPTKPLLADKLPTHNISNNPHFLPTQAPTSDSVPQLKQEKFPQTPATHQATVSTLPENNSSKPPIIPLPTSSALAKAEAVVPPKALPHSDHVSPNSFIPYEPEGPPAISLMHEKLHFLPPNTSTPANMKRERGELPVWTANSVIPFGVPTPKAEETTTDIWEIPETPDRKT